MVTYAHEIAQYQALVTSECQCYVYDVSKLFTELYGGSVLVSSNM